MPRPGLRASRDMDRRRDTLVQRFTLLLPQLLAAVPPDNQHRNSDVRRCRQPNDGSNQRPVTNTATTVLRRIRDHPWGFARERICRVVIIVLMIAARHCLGRWMSTERVLRVHKLPKTSRARKVEHTAPVLDQLIQDMVLVSRDRHRDQDSVVGIRGRDQISFPIAVAVVSGCRGAVSDRKDEDLALLNIQEITQLSGNKRHQLGGKNTIVDHLSIGNTLKSQLDIHRVRRNVGLEVRDHDIWKRCTR